MAGAAARTRRAARAGRIGIGRRRLRAAAGAQPPGVTPDSARRPSGRGRLSMPQRALAASPRAAAVARPSSRCGLKNDFQAGARQHALHSRHPVFDSRCPVAEAPAKVLAQQPCFPVQVLAQGSDVSMQIPQGRENGRAESERADGFRVHLSFLWESCGSRQVACRRRSLRMYVPARSGSGSGMSAQGAEAMAGRAGRIIWTRVQERLSDRLPPACPPLSTLGFQLSTLGR